MKKILFLAIAIVLAFVFNSCEKDEGKLPNISFKTGSSYISSDASLAGGSSVTIGINASKSEKKDVLKQFNISSSVNGGAAVSVYNKSLSGSEEDDYSYDFNTSLDTISGQTNKYTFTVTNRDGLTNQVSLVLTVQ